MINKRSVQVVAVVAAIGVLVWLLHRVGWIAIRAAFVSVGWTGAALLVAIAISESVLDGAALWTVVRSGLRLGQALGINAAGSLMNLLLPWESGEVLKGGFLRNALGSEHAIADTVIWNYVFKFSRPAVSALAAVLGAIWCRHELSRFTISIVLLANAAAFLPFVGMRFLVRYGAAAGVLRVLSILPGLRRRSEAWIGLARNVDQKIRSFRTHRPKDYLRVFLLQAAARATGWLSIFAAFRLIDLPYGFAEATMMYATMNVAEYVIALLPARVGVSEGTAFFAFRFLGLSAPMGVIVYVLLRVRTIAANGLMTPLAFVSWKMPPRNEP